MDIEIRTITEDEFPDFFTAVEAAFAFRPKDEDIASERLVAEVDRLLVAVDGSELVGGAGAYSFDLTVPGGTLPLAGVTSVGVRPTHRRRGILTALMRRQLDDVRDRGEALAGLFASEGSIYGRFGYGLATLAGSIRVDRDRAGFARQRALSGRVELVDRATALAAMPGPYEKVRLQVPGMLGRSGAWWDYRFHDPEHWRDGATEYFFIVHRTGDEVDGYVAYRVRHHWEEGVPNSELQIREILAAGPEAYEDLWRYLFGIDLMVRIEAWGRPLDEPLLHLLAEPRRLRFRVGDGLWVRLVDVPAALEGRRYLAADRVVLEVRDDFCPWNEGRYALEGGPDGATCQPTSDEPDLVADAADLGAVYLGGVRLSTLHAAGRVTELTPGAVRRAGAMFAWDPSPWCPHVF